MTGRGHAEGAEPSKQCCGLRIEPDAPRPA
jgi:hypothetical protein